MATDTIQPASTNVKEIHLPCGGIALVDAEDYERIVAVKWRSFTSTARRTTYARGRVGERSQGMHRVVLRLGVWHRGDLDVDHINGNGLDNRKCNLRLVTRRQNLLNTPRRRDNTSGYRGVHLRPSGKWRAEISVNGRIVVLGCHHRIEDAARAYDAAAIQYNGEFAKLNFPLAKAPESL